MLRVGGLVVFPDKDERECPSCGRMKDFRFGGDVCWDCFKYREDVTPLKYFGGSLSEWLKSIGREGATG